VTREFQTGKRGPTDEEMKTLERYDIEKGGPVSKSDKDDMDVRERIEIIKSQVRKLIQGIRGKINTQRVTALRQMNGDAEWQQSA
jgi:hypothetical protein